MNRLTRYVATEDTDITCFPMNATETGTVSNCNCFNLVDLSDSGGMSSDRFALNRANTNYIG
jgi:hypothetical protein